jgi:hypothetical protein
MDQHNTCAYTHTHIRAGHTDRQNQREKCTYLHGHLLGGEELGEALLQRGVRSGSCLEHLDVAQGVHVEGDGRLGGRRRRHPSGLRAAQTGADAALEARHAAAHEARSQHVNLTVVLDLTKTTVEPTTHAHTHTPDTQPGHKEALRRKNSLRKKEWKKQTKIQLKKF